MTGNWMSALLILGFVVTPVLGAEIEIDAKLDWSRRATLGTPITGIILNVAVRPGQRVKAGDLLLTLDSRGYQAEVAHREAVLKKARLDKEEAEREVERALDLYDRTLLSDHDRFLAEVDAARALAAWQAAKAGLTDARINLERCHLRAPFNGVVVDVLAVAGEARINRLKAETMVVLADDSQLLAHGAVTLDQANRLSEGGVAEVQLRGHWYQGTIRHLGMEPITRPADSLDYVLEVVFTKPAELLVRAGEPLVIRLQ